LFDVLLIFADGCNADRRLQERNFERGGTPRLYRGRRRFQACELGWTAEALFEKENV
jgi:hypothetical protein